MMKFILVNFTLVLFCLYSFAQDKFRRDYTLFSVFVNGKWQSPKMGNNTFVFNANQQNDIYMYPNIGGRIIYKRTTGIAKNYTSDGHTYQFLGALNDAGEEVFIQLFDDNNLGLKIIYLNGFMIQFHN